MQFYQHLFTEEMFSEHQFSARTMNREAKLSFSLKQLVVCQLTEGQDSGTSSPRMCAWLWGGLGEGEVQRAAGEVFQEEQHSWVHHGDFWSVTYGGN